MDFLYKDELNKIDSCPPSDYKTLELECFRWVYDNIGNEDNFRSQADKNPSRLNDKEDIYKCELHALSFHTSIDHSKAHFQSITKNMNKITKGRIGTTIAKGTIIETDGIGESKEGHFNFHPVSEHNFKQVFEIVDKL